MACPRCVHENRMTEYWNIERISQPPEFLEEVQVMMYPPGPSSPKLLDRLMTAGSSRCRAANASSHCSPPQTLTPPALPGCSLLPGSSARKTCPQNIQINTNHRSALLVHHHPPSQSNLILIDATYHSQYLTDQF